MYSSITVANHILRESWKRDIAISPMKLLKLVYIAHGWHLGLRGEKLIYDPVCAWPYGPVIPNLYFNINEYGSNPITSIITTGLGSSQDQELSKSVIEFLDPILNHYNKFSAFDLSALTHQKDSPWDQVVQNASKKELKSRSLPIPTQVIRNYYKSKLESEE